MFESKREKHLMEYRKLFAPLIWEQYKNKFSYEEIAESIEIISICMFDAENLKSFAARMERKEEKS